MEIKNLKAQVGDCSVLDGLSLEVPDEGGIHVIMGPNGSGKSSLCNVLLGHPDYQVTAGSVLFAGRRLLELDTDKRTRLGIFLGFQYPRAIPGVSLAQVMKAAVRARDQEDDQESVVDLSALSRQLKEELQRFDLSEDMLSRPLNEGASGGEKKRLEMVQLALLKPRLAILDEIDSGLDIDAIKQVASAIQSAVKRFQTTFLIVTHYQRLLHYLRPDRVHVMVKGQIVRSGGSVLAEELEQEGYKQYL